MQSDNIERLVCRFLSASTNVNSDNKHPLTPSEVRERYVEDGLKIALVVWHQSPYFGVKAGINELAWRTDDVRKIELGYCHSAKGSGYVLLDVELNESPEFKPVIFTRTFNPQLLEGFSNGS